MSVIGQAFVEILPFTGGFATKLGEEVTAATEGAVAKNGQMFDKLAGLGKAALTGLAIGVVAVGVESIKMADKFEASHARLTTAVEGSGHSMGQFSGQLDKAESSFEKLGYTHAQYEDALSRLTTATHDPQVAINDMGLAANIAAQRHMDLTSAAQLVGKVAEGNTGVLKRFGITLTDAGGHALNASDAMKALNERFGGAAQAQADTFGGKVKALEAKMQDIGTTIGLWLIPKLEDLANAVMGVISWFEQHTNVALGLAAAIGTTLVVAIGVYLTQLGIAAVQSVIEFGQMVASGAAWLAAHVAAMLVGTTATEGEAAAVVEAAAVKEGAYATEEAAIGALVAALEANTIALGGTTAAQDLLAESAVTAAGAEAELGAAAAEAGGSSGVGGLLGALGGLGAAGGIALGATVALSAAALIAFENTKKWSDITNTQKQYVADFVTALPPGTDVVKALGNAIDQTNSQMDGLSTQMQQGGKAGDDAAKKYDDLGKKLKLLYDAQGKAKDAAQAHKDATKDATEATKDNSGATQDNTTKTEDNTEKVKAAAQAEKDRKQSLNDTKTALDSMDGGLTGVLKTQIDVNKQTQDLTQSFLTNGGSLDINTDKGRANMTQVLSTRDAIIAHGKALIDNGQDIGGVNAVMTTQISQLDATLARYGYNKDQIQQYNQQLGLTPDQVSTALSASMNLDTTNAANSLNALWTQLDKDAIALAAVANPLVGIPGHAAGAVTSGPAIVGEGNRQYPEYVIPTDPAYRMNAIDLLGGLLTDISPWAHPPTPTGTMHQLGMHLPGMATGGLVGGIYGGISRTGVPGSAHGVNNLQVFTEADYVQYQKDLAAAAGNHALSQLVAANTAVANAQTAGIANVATQAAALVPMLIGPGIQKASTWLGVPYLWGGGHGVSEAVARRFGVDCSGLVDQVFGIQGTTLTQISMGQPVGGLASALSGDLVFFGAQAPGEPHHVGIYGGAGNMINAPHTGTVVRWDAVGGFGPIFGIRRIGTPGHVDPGLGLPASTLDNTSLGQSMAASRGWTGPYWDALYQIGTMESGWNQFARNASSGAYGIPQALPESKLPFAGQARGGSDPGAQIGWMLDYIAGRYGNPLVALSQEQAFHWYDDGGWLHPGLTVAVNTTGRSERVGGGAGFSLAPGAVVVNIEASFSGQPDPATVKQLQGMVRVGVTDALVAVLDRAGAHRPGG